jgi:hypothetical protein
LDVATHWDSGQMASVVYSVYKAIEDPNLIHTLGAETQVVLETSRSNFPYELHPKHIKEKSGIYFDPENREFDKDHLRLFEAFEDINSRILPARMRELSHKKKSIDETVHEIPNLTDKMSYKKFFDLFAEYLEIDLDFIMDSSKTAFQNIREGIKEGRYFDLAFGDGLDRQGIILSFYRDKLYGSGSKDIEKLIDGLDELNSLGSHPTIMKLVAESALLKLACMMTAVHKLASKVERVNKAVSPDFGNPNMTISMCYQQARSAIQIGVDSGIITNPDVVAYLLTEEKFTTLPTNPDGLSDINKE